MENDLISRSALLLELRESRSKERLPIPMYNVLSLAIGKVVDAPTIDAVPMVHGRWVQAICYVEFEDGFVNRLYECCSVCHEPNGIKTTDFCPSCGARMDVEEVPYAL